LNAVKTIVLIFRFAKKSFFFFWTCWQSDNNIKRREIKCGRRSGSLRCAVDEIAVAVQEAALQPQSNRWHNRDDYETPPGCAPRAPGGATCTASGAATVDATLARRSAVQRHRESFSVGYNNDIVEPSFAVAALCEAFTLSFRERTRSSLDRIAVMSILYCIGDGWLRSGTNTTTTAVIKYHQTVIFSIK